MLFHTQRTLGHVVQECLLIHSCTLGDIKMKPWTILVKESIYGPNGIEPEKYISMSVASWHKLNSAVVTWVYVATHAR